MSEATAAAEDGTREHDSPLGLRWYHWALVVALGAVQATGAGVSTSAGLAGAFVGSAAVSLVIVYFATAGWRRFRD